MIIQEGVQCLMQWIFTIGSRVVKPTLFGDGFLKDMPLALLGKSIFLWKARLLIGYSNSMKNLS